MNITREPLPFLINGPLGSVDQDKKLKLVLPPGHAVVATVVKIEGTGKQHFAHMIHGTKHGTRGVVNIGCVYISVAEAKKKERVRCASSRSKTCMRG